MEGGELLMWDLSVPEDENGELRRLMMPGQPAAVSALAVSPNRRYALAAYQSNDLALWEVEHGAIEHRLQHTNILVSELAAAPDGSVVFRYPDETIVIWEADHTMTTTSAAELGVSGVRLLPDGQAALANDTDSGALVRIDLRSGEVLQAYEQDFLAPGTIFTADGRLALSQSMLQTNQLAGSLGDTSAASRTVWAVETGEVVGTIDNPLLNFVGESAVYAFNADGSRLAAVSGGRDLIVMDTATGETLDTFTRDRDITAAAFVGETLIVGYADGGIAVLKPEDDAWRDLRTHTDTVLDITPHPGGHTMLTASADGTVLVWDIETIEPLRHFVTDTAGVRLIALPDGGERFATGSTDGTVILWQLNDNSELVEWARQNRFVVTFTASDCRAFQIPEPCG
jgi:WD40 repeat protein